MNYINKYIGLKLQNDIMINRLFTVHYFEYAADFAFTGEAHNFWEFVYVDAGEICVITEDGERVMRSGEIVFHKPCEWHNIKAGGVVANVAIVSFESVSKAMEFFCDSSFSVNDAQKNIISNIIREYKNAFSTPLNDINTTRLQRKETAIIGSEQLICMYICELLFSFMRANADASVKSPMISLDSFDNVLDGIVAYMKENLNRSLTLGELVLYSGSNRTTIINLFNNRFNMGAIEYFINLKIEAAKRYLREKEYNVTQIAELLGYSNIHYFSRQFKAKTGLSPLQYAASIKAMNENV